MERQKDTSSTTGQVSHTGLLVRRGRIIAMASVLAVAPMITGFPAVSSQAQAHPVGSQLRQVGFVHSSVASMRSARNATRSLTKPGVPDPFVTARAGAVTPVQDVAGAVTVVGVSWPKGAVSTRDKFQIRTFTSTGWGKWQLLDVEDGGVDPAEGSRTPTRGTSPYVVAGASKYEVRSLSTNQAAPAAAHVQVVDPGTSAADSIQQAPGAAAAATAMPTIYSRAQWGANEKLRRAAPSYGRIMLGIVHHTVSSNSYSASSVPAMIRGMYSYHVQSLKWSDIGYNFLIDRFGRIWEGRYGGVSRPVVGAQTANFNSVSTGVSAIGQYDIGAVPQVVTNAYKRLFAWKFSLAGIPAVGRVVANGKTLNRVSGHRDANQTACPGRYLYAKLPEIRTGAAALMKTSSPVVVPASVIRSVINRDADRNGIPDALSYSPGAGGGAISGSTALLTGTARAPVRSGVSIGPGWNSVRSAILSPDLSGDRRADIVALAGSSLRIYLGDGRGRVAGVLNRGSGWNSMSRVLAAGDRNRDGHNDILATTNSGKLVYYAGNGAGGFYQGRLIGSGWNTIDPLTSAGDLTGDGLPDLLGTRTSDSVQLLYAGAPGGSLRAGVVWGHGWGAMRPVIGGSDLDGDRYADVYARAGDGMKTYSSAAGGRFVRVSSWGAGWSSYTQMSTGADWNGDGTADLLAVGPAGTMYFFGGVAQLGPSYRVADLAISSARFPTVAGADLVRLVGDVNNDGYPDALARLTNGQLVFLRGQAGSTFVAQAAFGAGWDAFDLVEAAGDYDGDGAPDLLVRTTAGRLLVYPMTRTFGFKPLMVIGSGFQGMHSVVGAGAFGKDAYADVIALRASDHALILFRGTGSGGLLAGVVLAAAQNDVSQILGAGDYNGDGAADLIARSASGGLWLYPGNGLGAVGARLQIRGGEGASHEIG
jgi:hypothetical protein